jgi:hypothetical protein
LAADRHTTVSRLTGIDEDELTSLTDGDDEPKEPSCALELKARYWPAVRRGCVGALATETASANPSGFATLKPLPGGVIPLADRHPGAPAAAPPDELELPDPLSPAFTQL